MTNLPLTDADGAYIPRVPLTYDEVDDLAVRFAVNRSLYDSRRRRMTVAQRRRQTAYTIAAALLIALILLAGLELALGSGGPLGSFGGTP